MPVDEKKDFGWYYEKIRYDNNIQKSEIIELCSEITASRMEYGEELLTELSYKKNADDTIIRHLVKAVLSARYPKEVIPAILDNGSEYLFKKIGHIGNGDYYWKCKYADKSILMNVYADLTSSGVDDLKNKDKQCLFIHPNFPEEILIKYASNVGDLIIMAGNPNLENKPIIFKNICDTCNTTWELKDRWNEDTLLQVLLLNDSLNWHLVAQSIELETIYMPQIFNNPTTISNQRTETIYTFCKHNDCPDAIKQEFFKHTFDYEFLPNSLLDMFIF